jgi:hypothetical protein
MTPVLIAFAVSFLAVGIPYWSVPYAQVALPNTLWGFGLLVVLLSSAAVRAALGVTVLRTFAVVGASVPAAVLVRVIAGVSADATSHNLWPLELILAAAVGFPVALLGALAGKLFSKLSQRDA